MTHTITHNTHQTTVSAPTAHRAARSYAAQGRCKPLEQFAVLSGEERSVWRYDPSREHLVQEVLL
jgi:hypothetical protein